MTILIDVLPDDREDPAGLAEDLREVLIRFGIDEAEVCVRLTGDDEIAELNRHYRDIDGPTDVLSFAQMEGEILPGGHLGDIVISVDTACRQAREQRHDIETELRILARHGLLHLMGYDHDGHDPEAWRQAEGLLERRTPPATPGPRAS